MDKLNNYAVDLLDKELKFSLEAAMDMAEQLDEASLEPLCDVIKQIRGACVIAGLDGLGRLVDEMVMSLVAVQQGDSADLNAFGTLLVSTLIAATGYAGIVVSARRENVCVLLPEMTALRRWRGEPPLYEFHVLSGISWPAFDKEIASNPLAGEQREDVKRLWHLYQFGLLDIIRDNNRNKAFIILYRVALRLQNIAVLPVEKDYWWVIGVVIRALAENRLDLQVERVRLLSAVEKQLRLLAADNVDHGRNPYPEGLWRAFVSLTALIEARDDEDQQRRNDVGIPSLDFTEQDVSAIRRTISGESVDNGQEVFNTLAEMVSGARALVDVTQREEAGSAVGLVAELHGAFDAIETLWEEAGFSGLARRFRQFSARLQSNRPDSELPPEMIAEFIDAILQAECALVDFQHVRPSKQDAQAWERQPLTQVLQTSLLKTAELAVMNESGVHLGEIKEMIDNVASGYAAAEIVPTLESAFNTICGSARIMELNRFAELGSRSLTFVKNTLLSSPVDQQVENYWEVFADCIACLEYYIDSCKVGGRADEAPLDIANECLTSLGV